MLALKRYSVLQIMVDRLVTDQLSICNTTVPANKLTIPHIIRLYLHPLVTEHVDRERIEES